MTTNLSHLFNHPNYQTDQYHFLLNKVTPETFEETKEGLRKSKPKLTEEELENITKIFLEQIEKILK